MMNSERFLGKVAVITGAANGIGLATVALFASEGADVVAVDLHGVSFDAAVKQTKENGRQILTVEADVSQQADWANLVEQAAAKFGRIDILINCAGIAGNISNFSDVDIDLFDKVMGVNVRGVFLGMQAVAPMMKTQGSGHIVNVSSISGERGNPRVTPYVTSKHAVNGLTKCAALELIEHGIHVNAVAPAPIDTAMMRIVENSAAERFNVDTDAARQMLAKGMTMGRYGRPEEIAAAMAFLCSDDASFMTGAIVPVDGGALAR